MTELSENNDEATLKCQHDLINAELSKYSWETKRKFEKLFPCLNPKYTIEVAHKEYVREQKYIKAMVIVRNNNPKTEYAEIKEKYTLENLSLSSPEDFWLRWNKFKRVLTFA